MRLMKATVALMIVFGPSSICCFSQSFSYHCKFREEVIQYQDQKSILQAFSQNDSALTGSERNYNFNCTFDISELVLHHVNGSGYSSVFFRFPKESVSQRTPGFETDSRFPVLVEYSVANHDILSIYFNRKCEGEAWKQFVKKVLVSKNMVTDSSHNSQTASWPESWTTRENTLYGRHSFRYCFSNNEISKSTVQRQFTKTDSILFHTTVYRFNGGHAIPDTILFSSETIQRIGKLLVGKRKLSVEFEVSATSDVSALMLSGTSIENYLTDSVSKESVSINPDKSARQRLIDKATLRDDRYSELAEELRHYSDTSIEIRMHMIARFRSLLNLFPEFSDSVFNLTSGYSPDSPRYYILFKAMLESTSENSKNILQKLVEKNKDSFAALRPLFYEQAGRNSNDSVQCLCDAFLVKSSSNILVRKNAALSLAGCIYKAAVKSSEEVLEWVHILESEFINDSSKEGALFFLDIIGNSAYEPWLKYLENKFSSSDSELKLNALSGLRLFRSQFSDSLLLVSIDSGDKELFDAAASVIKNRARSEYLFNELRFRADHATDESFKAQLRNLTN